MKNHAYVFVVLSTLLVLVGCGQAEVQNQETATSTQVTTTQAVNNDKLAEDTALSNPATVYCLARDGKFDMQKTLNGTMEGYCTLPSGIKCEVWAYYKGECAADSKEDKIEDASTTASVADGNASSTLDAGATSTTQTACTMEAKICPDGSAVGRTGPNCEFAPCPESKVENSEESTDKTASDTDKNQPTVDSSNTGAGSSGGTEGLVLSVAAGDEAGELVTSWKTNGLKAPDGFIVMLSGSENITYPTKYFHALQNQNSKAFTWVDLTPDKTYYFRVCIAVGDSCGTYSNVASGKVDSKTP